MRVGCFPGVPRAQGWELAERVRSAVEAATIAVDDVSLNVPVSVGLATFPGDCERPSELFTIADRALYKAKREGRNRVATPTPNDLSDGHPTLR